MHSILVVEQFWESQRHIDNLIRNVVVCLNVRKGFPPTLKHHDVPNFSPKSVATSALTVKSFWTLPISSTAWLTCKCAS